MIPTLPPLIAAQLKGIPTLIHDFNAVMGRANSFLSKRVSAIATSLPGVLDKEPSLIGKTTTTGTPMRPSILAAAMVPFRSTRLDHLCAAVARGRATPSCRRSKSNWCSRRGAIDIDRAGARRTRWRGYAWSMTG